MSSETTTTVAQVVRGMAFTSHTSSWPTVSFFTVLALSGPLGLVLAWHKRRLVSALSVLGWVIAAVFIGPLCLLTALVVPSRRESTA